MSGKNEKTALIIGAGSIGLRHAVLLEELGFLIDFVTKREDLVQKKYISIEHAFKEKEYDYIIISNETSKHYSTLSKLEDLGYSGTVLVEKPLFHQVMDLKSAPFHLYVAYHLRFHPLLKRLKKTIKNEKVLSAHGYVGQYLPTWRSYRPYNESYSTKRSEGGGVLRDLSHELDYLFWLFGSEKSCCALIGKYSSLKIDSEDVAGVLMSLERCPVVTLQMNYYDKMTQRELIVNTENHTYKIDFIKNEWCSDGVLETLEKEYNQPYRDMHNAVLNHFDDDVCSFDEGLRVVQLIERLEKSCVL